MDWIVVKVITSREQTKSIHYTNYNRFSAKKTEVFDSFLTDQLTLFACLTLTAMAILLGLTDMVYDLLIIWEPIAASDVRF